MKKETQKHKNHKVKIGRITTEKLRRKNIKRDEL